MNIAYVADEYRLCAHHRYHLELSQNADALVCFHSKVALGATNERRGRPEILGIPISFTTNPKTRENDYVYSTMETLSLSACVLDHITCPYCIRA